MKALLKKYGKPLLDFYAQHAKLKRLKDNYHHNGGTIFNAFDQTNSIFIHIPKTAGIAVGKSLYGENISWGHYTWKEVESVMGSDKFNSYFKFAFVRNPWSRIFSAYHFLMKGGINEVDKYFYEQVLSQYDTFERFIMEGLGSKEVSNWIHFLPQTDFICDRNGNLKVDFIAKLENIQEDYNTIRERVGGEELLIRNELNKDKTSYKSIYTSEMIKKVYELYKLECILFNYTYDD